LDERLFLKIRESISWMSKSPSLPPAFQQPHLSKHLHLSPDMVKDGLRNLIFGDEEAGTFAVITTTTTTTTTTARTG
jgi:hypothetical protein